ncbi:sister chromatid cohesion protein PDS5 homolog A-like [Leptopilina heterotoma]|uniref:sister chromatid cohesion protein PDS5 homolog A-like n=1 Tax=Leptopilina heterotoma TaxID=63436 RepID=UPI001CA9A22A|nr:sister chromatid cohesion protein PDS5 homolog A-like [Leptopilina heterotoma]
MDLEINFEEKLDFIIKSILRKSRNVNLKLLQELFENVTWDKRKKETEIYEISMKMIEKWSIYLTKHFRKFIELSKETNDDLLICVIFDVAYELRDIYPGIVGVTVLHDAIVELNSKSPDIHLTVINFLGKFLSKNLEEIIEKKENFFRKFLKQLWNENEKIQLLTTYYVKKIFLKYPMARKLITKYLQSLKYSSKEEKLKIAAISLITSIIYHRIEILQENKFFREFVVNLVTDKEASVRERELTSLAIIFHKYVKKLGNLPLDLRKILMTIESKLMYEFSIRKNLDDRILIEELFSKYLVSCQLPIETRMKRFLHFYVSLHPMIIDNYKEFHWEKIKSRKLLQLWTKFIKEPNNHEEIMIEFQGYLCEKNPLVNSIEFIEYYEDFLNENQAVVDEMEKICLKDILNNEAIEALKKVKIIFSRSDLQDGEVFLQIIKRGTPFVFDSESIRVLIDYILQVLNSNSIAEELDLDPNISRERGIKLLNLLADCHPELMETEDFLTLMIKYLNKENNSTNCMILKLLKNIGKKMSISNIIESESTMKLLFTSCEYYALEGTKEEAKISIECIKYSTNNYDNLFDGILQKMMRNSTLMTSSDFFLQSIVSLGQIAIFRTNDENCPRVENLIGQIFDFIGARGTLGVIGIEDKFWCTENELPMNDRCYEESIKCICRWITSLNIDSDYFQFYGEQFLAIVKRHLFEEFSKTEPRRNRLRAISACAILKLCKFHQFRLNLPLNFFYQLSQLINDKCFEVSKYFIEKLLKLLKENVYSQFLTNEFFAFFILLRGESQFIDNVRNQYESIIEQRSIFVNYILQRTESNPFRQEKFRDYFYELIPEFSLIPALLIYAHESTFDDCRNLSERDLNKFHQVLRIYLEPIIEKSCFDCADLFERIVRKVENSFEPEFPHLKEKFWTLNQLILSMIERKQITSNRKKIFQGEIKIPRIFHLREMNFEETV